VRRWSIVGALALVLVFSTSVVSPASAQTPVATTTVAGSPDDPSKDGAKATEEQPKPEKPKGEEPAADAPAAPSADAAKPKPEAPKATEPKPTGDEAKPEKTKAAAPKPTKPEQTKPAEPKPKAEKPKPAEPKPKAEKPKPAEPKPKAEKPKPAETKPEDVKPTSTGKQPKPDKPKATADEPIAPLHVAAAQSSAPTAAPAAPAASPTRQAAPAVAGARAKHVGSTRAERTTAPPDRGGTAGAARSDPALIRTAGDPGSATHATGRSAEAATTHPARLAPDDAARAAAPSERRPIRALPLDAGPSGYDLTLLLTIVFAAGVAFLIGRETHRLPRGGAWRWAALGTRRVRRLPPLRAGVPVRDSGVRGQVVVPSQLDEDASGLLRPLLRLRVGEDLVGIDADDDVLAEAVARLPGDAPLAQSVDGAMQGIVVLDIQLHAPVVGHATASHTAYPAWVGLRAPARSGSSGQDSRAVFDTHLPKAFFFVP
jgi:hypothetical protein